MDRQDVILLAYVPVLHEGYRQLFEKHRTAREILIFGNDLIAESDYLRKEIRALDPQHTWVAIQSWLIGPIVAVATPRYLNELNKRTVTIVMPDEDVCRQVAEKYLPNHRVVFERVFLRWDRTNTMERHAVRPDQSIPATLLDRALIKCAFAKAEQSSDWWRQVGAIAVRHGAVLLSACNRHMPSPHTPYANGDPRNAFSRGVNIEVGTALHAEQAIICEAARRGIALNGAYLYVSTFPCPPCAKAIVTAGFRRCYYRDGYAMLDGESVLRAGGVEIVHVADT